VTETANNRPCECTNPTRSLSIWRDDPEWWTCVQCDGRVRPLTTSELADMAFGQGIGRENHNVRQRARSFDDVDIISALSDALLPYNVPTRRIIDEFLALCRDPAYLDKPVPAHELPDIPEPGSSSFTPNSPFGL
jgi:hypothetical protein